MRKHDEEVRLFVSYSHKDEIMAKELLTHLEPLRKPGEFVSWYDRMIDPGHPWSREIEDNLLRADIILYCISSDFIVSQACINELKKGIKLHDKAHTVIFPVIFRDCAWKDCKIIKEMLALPTDGKAIATYTSKDSAYNQIYEFVKKTIKDIKARRGIDFTSNFKRELFDVGALKSLSFINSRELSLQEIYVYPELRNESLLPNLKEYEEANSLIKEIGKIKRYVIAGEAQSGKSALCRQWVNDLLELGYFPILLSSDLCQQGDLLKKIDARIRHQFTNYEYVDKRNVVLVIDDFHKVTNKESVLDAISCFEFSIIIVDDIYNLDIEKDKILGEYSFFMLEPFSAIKRNELISKWIRVQEEATGEKDENFERLDALTRDVDFTLGKVLGRGVIPAYPFFVLSILASVETAHKPMDGEITSQGFCYHTLLVLALAKVGVSARMLDSYMNFLTFLGYYHFKTTDEISHELLESFISDYRKKFNLTLEDAVLLKRLSLAGIYVQKINGKFTFGQRYLKYYFIAKYISENPEECRADYEKIVQNIGSSSNAYIAVFITHHSKTLLHIEEIRDMLNGLFKGVTPGYLDAAETDKLDRQSERVVKAFLPDAKHTPLSARRQQLDEKEERERRLQEEPKASDPTVRDLIMALRGADVLGQIIKCRAGSIKLPELKKLIETIINIHAKVITVFISTFEKPGDEECIIDYISTRLEKRNTSNPEKVKLLAERIFWNLNYFTILGLTFRCISDVGADTLSNVIDDVCASKGSTFSRIIPYGVKMWFNKRLDVSGLSAECKNSKGIAKWMLQHLTVRYCATHRVPYKDRQQIEEGMDIKTSIRLNPING